MGHLNGILARVGGNLNNDFQKSQMPGGLPGGMLKLRFDRYISNKLRIKQRITEDAHLPYTLTNFSPKFRQKKLKSFTLKNLRFKIHACSSQVFVLQHNNGFHE